MTIKIEDLTNISRRSIKEENLTCFFTIVGLGSNVGPCIFLCFVQKNQVKRKDLISIGRNLYEEPNPANGLSCFFQLRC